MAAKKIISLVKHILSFPKSMNVIEYQIIKSLIRSHTFVQIEERNLEYISRFAAKWKGNRTVATICAQTKNGGWLGFLGNAFPFTTKYNVIVQIKKHDWSRKGIDDIILPMLFFCTSKILFASIYSKLILIEFCAKNFWRGGLAVRTTFDKNN